MYELLEKLCKENGITITKLCVEITGSKGNLPTWKKGNINPSSLNKIADYFNISVDYLLGRTETPQNTANKSNIINNTSVNNSSINQQYQEQYDEMSKELLKKFNKLSFDDKIEVFNIIKQKEKK